MIKRTESGTESRLQSLRLLVKTFVSYFVITVEVKRAKRDCLPEDQVFDFELSLDHSCGSQPDS